MTGQLGALQILHGIVASCNSGAWKHGFRTAFGAQGSAGGQAGERSFTGSRAVVVLRCEGRCPGSQNLVSRFQNAGMSSVTRSLDAVGLVGLTRRSSDAMLQLNRANNRHPMKHDPLGKCTSPKWALR
jgi:hypothetical protein